MKWSIQRVLVALALTAFCVAALPAAADTPIPLDRDGLPAWSVKEWTDFPVRLDLADRAALENLLAQIPIADFHREQVAFERRGQKQGRAVVETRVTEAEFAALERAGYQPLKLHDVERENRQASERLWADMAAGKVAGSRTDPLNYVPTNDQLQTMLQGIANDYPSIARYFTWGSSVQGRTLHGLVISDNPTLNEAEPEVRYSSSMHGDEIVGMVLTVNLAYYLVEHYGEAGYEEVTDLVDNFELTLMPAYNPDGTNLHQRYNANGVDLNRNFELPSGSHSTREIETIQFMNHANQHHYVVSINFHGGALVMNYPWDYTYTLAPDNDAMIELSLEYSELNLPMYNGAFDRGITNGAEWYVADGTLQDWSYDQTDCIDVTCEVSNTKWPSSSTFLTFWNQNRDAMMAYMRSARDGSIHGIVTDSDTGLPVDATVSFVGNPKVTHTDPANGDYYKLAETGTFDVQFEALGYVPQTIAGVSHTWGTGTVVDVALVPLPAGLLSGTVTDLSGAGLDALVEIRTYPGDVIVDSVTSDGGNGGSYSLQAFYGDYTVTASATDHFSETAQVTLGATPVVLDFELGGLLTSYPVDEDFELGAGDFVGDWILATPGHDSDQCLTDGEGSYPNNAVIITETVTSISLADVMDPLVTFSAKWSIENSWDAVFFEISTDGGNAWQALAVPGQTEPASGQGSQTPAGTPCFDGQQANWVGCTVDLSSFIGEDDVTFRFRLDTDTSQTYDGFYFDDFLLRIITEDNGVTTVDLPLAAAGASVFPNPFNPQATIAFSVPRDGAVRLAVYDLAGRLVRTLVEGEVVAGTHEVAFDGRGLASGTYVYRLEGEGFQLGDKMQLVK